MHHDLNEFFIDHSAPDYYYVKKSEPLIDLGPAPNQEGLASLIQYSLENKNPLNIAVPGAGELTHGITYPYPFYSWPIPMCFTWPEYKAASVEGITQYRLADQFWDNIASAKSDPDHPTGFTVTAAEIRLFTPGTCSYRIMENPGGPTSHRWHAGGSCRLLVPLMAGEGAKLVVGSLKAPTTLTIQPNTVYEWNNLIPYKWVNDSNADLLFIQIDLCPNEKLVEFEERILAHPTLSQLHVKFAAGFPVHPTVHL